VTILRQLSEMKNNKFTTKILDVITSEDINHMNYIFIVMESSDCDLKQLLNKIKYIEFDEGHIVTIMYNSLCALNFIHSANVMHRDIKPANILINHDCEITICDFGLSRTVPSNLLIPKFYNDTVN
jgi:mitogen-activated protein kinase 1/3